MPVILTGSPIVSEDSEAAINALLDEVPDAETSDAEPTVQGWEDSEERLADPQLPGDAQEVIANPKMNEEQESPEEVEIETPATSEADLKGGFICKALDFYRKDGEWSQTSPYHLPEAAENNETAQHAILKRNEKSSDSRKKLSLHSIIIQSPLIKSVLGKVFEGYDGITTELDRLELKKPFEPFVHRWEKFRLARNYEQDPDTRDHLDLLNIIYAELKFTLARRDDLLMHGVMRYDLLWTMFEPETLVFQEFGESKSERVTRVDSYSYGRSFAVTSRYVEWEGTKFGMDSDCESIGSFNGTKKITDLKIYPLAYHRDAIGVQRRCIARAREWETYCRYSFKQYIGVAVSSRSRMHVDARVIINTEAYNKFNPNSEVTVWKLENDKTYQPPATDEPEPETLRLKPWQLLLATNMLKAYSLKDKVWMTIHLAGIQEITWNDDAFSRLVLPDDTKDLVLAFAKSQILREQTFDDIIQGKGKGVIMLLSGPPGVGKTLTAEAVAETMRVPLYIMAAGDLGADAEDVENELKTICAMTTRWKAVLLLDEADIYLEARSTHDLQRNKLVSVFLRILEYYEGFLFLTSNRVDNIDAAFESRIHLSLMYNGLSFESRRQVLITFTKDQGFTDKQIDALAEMELNGRQIKNILKTAQLLATSSDSPLNFGHVQTITKLRAANSCVPLRGSVDSFALTGSCKIVRERD
ncbi:hypothetical protein ONS95_006757 [Cadophora gregata]|uniref:uncharacterized protein n=1 Tax=Cadophora gregata TaxID=51156 RepID=UPI0026DA9827|nr:uncharacterized protein ONS95_006757 [Cadophora gregata]KAK0101594.1 hypothetical protein ONS95_006757 [Cadophora gregata]KAK0106392.1 hypothetical protein ONS96_004024 [Cadophora gregata f. sp. sojae]